jgi:hypothetical protein
MILTQKSLVPESHPLQLAVTFCAVLRQCRRKLAQEQAVGFSERQSSSFTRMEATSLCDGGAQEAMNEQEQFGPEQAFRGDSGGVQPPGRRLSAPGLQFDLSHAGQF